MDTIKLLISVFELRTQRHPNRHVELQCRIRNIASADVCILDAWLKIETPQGLNLAEGRLFYSMHNLVDPAVIPSGKEGLGAIVIPLPSDVLLRIEETRAGGDITFRVTSRIIVSRVDTHDNTKTLGVPFPAQFDEHGMGYFDYTVPQSEWIKALSGLGWSELELLEIPTAKINAVPALARAYQRFQDAQDCYRRGYWEESMINCRKAFEAAIKDTVGEDDLKGTTAAKAFEAFMSDGPKVEQLNEIVKGLREFLALARHEQLPPIVIKPADARVALHLTGAILAYLAGQ